MRLSIFVMALTISTSTLAGQRATREGGDSNVLPNFVPEYKVTDPTGVGESFGWSDIGITSTGLALVAANNDTVGTTQHEGKVYFYLKAGDGSWGLKQTLTDSAGQFDEHFGFSLALRGTTAVIGAIGANSGKGRALVFDYANGTWTQVATLAPSDLGSNAGFGYSVAINASTILVGAPSFAFGTSGGGGGAVYAFQKNGSGVWTQVQEFTSSNDLSTDDFGASLAVSGTTAIIAAPRLGTGLTTDGSVYVFDVVGGSWTQQQEIYPGGLGTFDSTAMKLAMRSDTALIGAPSSTINLHPGEGIVYVLKDSGGTWAQTQQIYLGSTHSGEHFGRAVDIADNGDVLIGAPQTTIGGNSSQGKAYLYTENASGSYVSSGNYLASDGSANDYYGSAVAFDKGATLLGGPTDVAIGAFGVKDVSGNVVGAAYLYPYP